MYMYKHVIMLSNCITMSSSIPRLFVTQTKISNDSITDLRREPKAGFVIANTEGCFLKENSHILYSSNTGERDC